MTFQPHDDGTGNPAVAAAHAFDRSLYASMDSQISGLPAVCQLAFDLFK